MALTARVRLLQAPLKSEKGLVEGGDPGEGPSSVHCKPFLEGLREGVHCRGVPWETTQPLSSAGPCLSTKHSSPDSPKTDAYVSPTLPKLLPPSEEKVVWWVVKSQTVWVCMPPPSPTSCENLGKCLNLSVPQFALRMHICKMGIIIIPIVKVVVMIKRVNVKLEDST